MENIFGLGELLIGLLVLRVGYSGTASNDQGQSGSIDRFFAYPLVRLLYFALGSIMIAEGVRRIFGLEWS